LVSHGFGFYLDSKLLAESYFVSLRETVASGAKNRNRFDFLGFDLYSSFLNNRRVSFRLKILKMAYLSAMSLT
jgi:hypothetical protein